MNTGHAKFFRWLFLCPSIRPFKNRTEPAWNQSKLQAAAAAGSGSPRRLSMSAARPSTLMLEAFPNGDTVVKTGHPGKSTTKALRSIQVLQNLVFFLLTESHPAMHWIFRRHVPLFQPPNCLPRLRLSATPPGLISPKARWQTLRLTLAFAWISSQLAEL